MRHVSLIALALLVLSSNSNACEIVEAFGGSGNKTGWKCLGVALDTNDMPIRLSQVTPRGSGSALPSAFPVFGHWASFIG
ncbi:hypothetical protein, partial [uncultured Lamprocystis sp.]|uniref:hypothetical protein n=1 Tax=uncultured Lamprocystis sp. TaxID=543132 RepID=UPI0025DB9265